MNIEVTGAKEAAAATDRLARRVSEIPKKVIPSTMAEIARDARSGLSARPGKIGTLVAPTVRATGDTVVAGGARRVSSTATAGVLFWGAEKGGGGSPRTRQFGRWNPRGWGWLPAIRAGRRRMRQAALDEITDGVHDWGRGG